MLHTKSLLHWPFDPENKIFKWFLPYMGMVALTFATFYSHCLIRFNTSSEKNDFGFNSIKKSTFQKIPHSNALGSKFDLDLDVK